MKSFSARVLAVIAVLLLIGNVFQYLHYSTSRPLVTVGGEVITKKQYLDQLEHQAGQPVLTALVTEKLVAQAAARAEVMPTARDVDTEIAEIQRAEPQMLAEAMQDPVKMAEVRQTLQTRLALDNLRIRGIALTPAQVAAFYTVNTAKFALPQQVEATTVMTANAIDAKTAADLLRQNTPTDVVARRPRLLVPGLNAPRLDLTTLPLASRQQIKSFVDKAKVGEVKTFFVKTPKESLYLTFQVTKSSRATLPSLAQIRSQVYRQACLAKAPEPQEEMNRLYQAAKPTFNSDKYAAYFDRFQHSSVKTARVP